MHARRRRRSGPSTALRRAAAALQRNAGPRWAELLQLQARSSHLYYCFELSEWQDVETFNDSCGKPVICAFCITMCRYFESGWRMNYDIFESNHIVSVPKLLTLEKPMRFLGIKPNRSFPADFSRHYLWLPPVYLASRVEENR